MLFFRLFQDAAIPELGILGVSESSFVAPAGIAEVIAAGGSVTSKSFGQHYHPSDEDVPLASCVIFCAYMGHCVAELEWTPSRDYLQNIV
jgi:hypothetical protein